MSQITKKALAASLVKLLNETTLDKITVKDIVDDCGVNRNTFYYHFQDIYDLMDWIFVTEIQKIVDDEKICDNWQQCFLQIANYLLENDTQVYHTFNAIKCEDLEQYLYSVTDNLMFRFVNEQAKGMKISEEDQKFIADFYKYALVGLVLEWIRTGMKEDPENMINKISKIFEGHIKSVLHNCKEE